MGDLLEIGTLLAELLPGLITVYDKIVANNQNAGLVPSATLLADALKNSAATAATAQAQIAAAEGAAGV